MAKGNKIRGITIELGADVKPIDKALEKVDSSLKNTQTQLKDVNKLLKLDPTNVELLKQKQDLLKQATADTSERLKELHKALETLQNAPNADKTIEQQNALKREIIDTERALESYDEQLKNSSVTLNVIAGKSEEVAEKTQKLSAAAAGLAGAMIGNAIAMASTADDLNALSQQTGLTVEEIQKMQYASDVVDVSVEQMTGSIQKMTKQMSSSPKAFEELGVSIYDANGNMRDATDVWYESLEALSKIDNETERDAKSMEIFGKSAMDMAGIIDDGGASLKALGDEAEDLGLIMGQDMVDDANELQDAIDRMKGRTTQAFAKMGASLAKSLVPMFDKLLNVVTKVVTWFSNLDGKTQKLIIAILGLIAAISPVASIIAKITSVASGLSAAFTFMCSPIGLVVAAIAGMIAIGVTFMKHLDDIKAKASALGVSISDTFENIKNSVSDKINAAKDAVSRAIDRIKGLFKFEWSWPKIKLPHFRISGGVFPYGLFNKGTLPKIDIDWYAKAMKNGMILNNPTIFGAMNGKLLGGGEAGSETIVGTNSLMNMIRQASQGTTLNGDIVINMNVPQGANGRQLVDQIEKELSLRMMRRSEVY